MCGLCLYDVVNIMYSRPRAVTQPRSTIASGASLRAAHEALRAFAPGDVVQLSDDAHREGIDARGPLGRRGVVTKMARDGCPWVIWDDRKTASIYHPSFLVVVDDRTRLVRQSHP